MKLRAMIRRIHKYITGGTRFYCAAKRWCPSISANNVSFDDAVRMLRNQQRLLRIGGRKEQT